jgi:PAS domain S-box-containing protein
MRKSIKASREEEVLRDFMRVLNMVRAANLILVHASEERPFLKEFCKIIVETGGYAFAWVGYAESDGPKRIVPMASWGEHDDYLTALTFTWGDEELGRSPTGAAIRTGEPSLCQDLQADPDFAPWRDETLARGFASCLALPLSTPEKPLGALTIFADHPDAFQANEVEVLSKLAETLTYGVMALRTRSESRQLKEKLDLKAQMLDFASEAIFVQDLAGRFIEFNQATYQDLGYSQEELRQLNRFQLETPEYAKLQDKRLQELLGKGEAVFEAAHFRKDSSVMPLKIHSRILAKDGQKVILSAAQDATQVRQATESLQQAEERYQTILERARLGVFRLRLSNGRMEEANPRLAQIFGFDNQAEFLKDFVLTKHFVEPGTQQKMFAAFKNGDLRKFEARCYRKDGSTVWVLFSARLFPAQGCLEGVASDISDLKQLEENLHKSEDKYRVLVEQQLGRSLLYAMERNRLKQEASREKELSEKLIKNSEDGILTFDRNFRLTLWNDGMEAMTGLSRKKLLNKSLFTILPVFKELHETQQVFGAAPAKNILDSSRPMRLSPLSPIGYFEGHFFPLKNDAGEVIGGLIVIRNLTKLKQAEAALKAKDGQLANLFDSLQEGLLVLDQEFTILKANQLMEQWYAHEQPLLGRKCYEVLLGRTRPCENCPGSRLEATGEIHHEVIPRRGPGGEVVGRLDLSAYPLIDQETGKCVGIIERAADISEGRRKEEALKEAEERYRLIAKSIPLIGARAYADGTIDFFDDKITVLTGYAREEFDARRLKWIDLVVEEDRNNLHRAIAQASKQDGSYSLEYRIKTKARKTLWLQESGHITLTADGNLDQIDMVLFDITERKQNEEIAPKLEAQLRQAQRMEAIGTLAGGIAHDFNNILGVMLGYAEMALYSLKEDNDLKRKLQQILKAGQRGKDLVSQILAFSRPGKPERKPIKVSPIIKETLKMLRATVPTTIALRSNTEEEKDAIQADSTQIHQVLINLCANAAHAMRETGGVLEVSLQAVDLDEAAAAQYHDLSPGPYAMISIKDTGHGMDKEVRERIFDPFFTTKAPGEGTGMGLAVVHGILKAHGGTITVQSEPGVGTEFQIFLPRISDTPASGVKERSRMDKGQGNLLFVDDEEWLVEMWQEILENMGFEVDPYTASQDALEAFRAQPEKYDLVITDQTMAHMTGFELAKAMLEIRPEFPIILCTGYSELVTPEKAKAAGIREYVMKPLSISELTGAIRRALGMESASLKA